jgi:predicted dehydrogenase
VGIVGAARRRHGLGPFVVRDLRDAGASIPCFLATRPSTRDATRRELARSWGVECRGYLDFDAMLREEALDAVAILSPSETHADYLGRALAAGLHTLCEKPLLWNRADPVAEATQLVDGFERRGLLLHENCQWPYTLDAFARLHPGILDEPPRHFEMQMQPASPGIGRLGDSLPHALSLLQALAPGEARLEQLAFAETPADAGGILDISFTYRTGGACPRAHIALQRSDAFPRRCAYRVNDREALRVVDAEYRLHLVDGEHRVLLDDPLSALVADFVAAVAARRDRVRRDEILGRVALLEQIARGYRRWDRSGAA